jgi:hypothetical protein
LDSNAEKSSKPSDNLKDINIYGNETLSLIIITGSFKFSEHTLGGSTGVRAMCV